MTYPPPSSTRPLPSSATENVSDDPKQVDTYRRAVAEVELDLTVLQACSRRLSRSMRRALPLLDRQRSSPRPAQSPDEGDYRHEAPISILNSPLLPLEGVRSQDRNPAIPPDALRHVFRSSDWSCRRPGVRMALGRGPAATGGLRSRQRSGWSPAGAGHTSPEAARIVFAAEPRRRWLVVRSALAARDYRIAEEGRSQSSPRMWTGRLFAAYDRPFL
jgi:hypothetical protein